MSRWPAAKASRVLAALLRLGWQVQRQSGSHRTLRREGWPDSVFAFHDSEEIGPKNALLESRSTLGFAPRTYETSLPAG